MFCSVEKLSWINHELIIECIVGKIDGELLPFLSNHNWRSVTPFYVLESGLLLIKGPTICSMGQQKFFVCTISFTTFSFSLLQPSHSYRKWHKCSDLCFWLYIYLNIWSIFFVPPSILLHKLYSAILSHMSGAVNGIKCRRRRVCWHPVSPCDVLVGYRRWRVMQALFQCLGAT